MQLNSIEIKHLLSYFILIGLTTQLTHLSYQLGKTKNIIAVNLIELIEIIVNCSSRTKTIFVFSSTTNDAGSNNLIVTVDFCSKTLSALPFCPDRALAF